MSVRESKRERERDTSLHSIFNLLYYLYYMYIYCFMSFVLLNSIIVMIVLWQHM